MKAMMVAAGAALVAGCAGQAVAPAPQVEYKTQVIDTSCQSFKLILVPKTFLQMIALLPADQRMTFDPLGVQILAHDQEYKAKCMAPTGR